MIHIEGSKRLAIVLGLAIVLLQVIMSVGIAQAVTFHYTLDNVILADGQPITGEFDWTFNVGDFEGGSGVFTTLDIPWTVFYNFAAGNLIIDIQTNSIEISGDGSFHDQGLDIRLVLSQPFNPTQSAPIDLTLSWFECCGNGFKDQPFISGSISPMAVPIPDLKANSSDGPIILTQGSNLTVSMSLDPGGYEGDNADWRIFLFYYNSGTGSWVPFPLANFQSPLFALPPTTLINTSGLPAGLFAFFYGVDLNMNGIFDNPLYSDIVVVIIQ
jgi:hypothetical protein